MSQDVELTWKNTSVSIVGKGSDFILYDDEEVQQWLDKLDSVSNARNKDDDDEDDDEPKVEEPKVEETTDAPPAETEGEAASEDRMDTDE